jgi:hypothetical protein
MNSVRTARVAPEKRLHRPPAVAFSAVVKGEDMAMTYREQLLHPNWQRKRLECLEAAAFECEVCGDGQNTLHVHHKRYVKGRMAWDYPMSELAVLCAACHTEDHANRALLDRMIAESTLGTYTVVAAVALLAGYLDGQAAIDPALADDARKLDGSTYDGGLFAGMCSGATWEKLSEAAKVLSPVTASPAERVAMARWAGDA